MPKQAGDSDMAAAALIWFNSYIRAPGHMVNNPFRRGHFRLTEMNHRSVVYQPTVYIMTADEKNVI